MPARLIPRHWPVVLLLLLSTACATLGVGRGGDRPLAAPSALSDRSFQQVLRIRFDGSERRLIAAGRIRDGVLRLSLLTPEGLEVLRLRQDDAGVRVLRERGLPDALDPRAIVADFQLVHWPADALRAAYGEGWTLSLGPHSRVLSRGGRAWVRVDYAGRPWHGDATLTHRRYGYRLRVQTLEHHLLDDSGEARTGQ